jgi:type II secretion system protein N
MPEFGDLLSLDYWREHSMALVYALAALMFFVIFTVGTFPYDQALTGVLLPLGLKISYQFERPAFPVGAVLQDVMLISLDRPSAPPLVRSEALKLTPGLGTLIGRPAIGMRADMYGGRVRAKVRSQGNNIGLDLSLSDIDLARYPIPSTLGTMLKGIVSGQADFQDLGPAMNAQKGDITLEGHGVEFSVVKGFPSLRFALLKGSCTIDHATLRINALFGKGPDMTISGSGVIHIGPTPAQSIMVMTLRIAPTVAGRARLGVLFAFLPHPPDNRPYIIHGPLLMPQAS